MTQDNPIIPLKNLQSLIYTVRGEQVMLDSDLAEIYEVEPRRLNEQVKRNIERFPESFRFQLTEEEYQQLVTNRDQSNLRSQSVTIDDENLKSQNATSSNSESLRSQNATLNKGGRGQHRKYLPYVFTEQGVSMLSAVLRSETAIKVSIQIINAFVEMRRFIQNNASIFARIDSVEKRQLHFESKTEAHFEKVFQALDLKNQQYPAIRIKTFHDAHDRFLILDDSQIYHIGASLKDLGKKWFAFSKFESGALEMLQKLGARERASARMMKDKL